MSEKSMEKLLLAYRTVCVAQMTSVAELLEDVILELMKGERTPPIVIGESRTTTEPPWKFTCGPDIVPLGATMECMGIDHLSEEVTS